jgi:hypothetical protein
MDRFANSKRGGMIRNTCLTLKKTMVDTFNLRLANMEKVTVSKMLLYSPLGLMSGQRPYRIEDQQQYDLSKELDTYIDAFSVFLASPFCKIKSLNVQRAWTQVSEMEIFCQALVANQSLEFLDMDIWSFRGSEGTERVSRIFMECLQFCHFPQLSLRCSDLSPNSLERLCYSISKNKYITDLKLTLDNIGCSVVDFSRQQLDFNPLIQVLSQCENVKKLDISRVHHGPIQVSPLVFQLPCVTDLKIENLYIDSSSFAEALSSNKVLKVLNLCGLLIHNKGCRGKFLAENLPLQIQALENLSLDRSETLALVKDGLPRLFHLKELDITHSDKTGDNLFPILANTGLFLEKLKLGYFPNEERENDLIFDVLADLLKRNKNMTQLSLCSSAEFFSDKFIEAVKYHSKITDLGRIRSRNRIRIVNNQIIDDDGDSKNVQELENVLKDNQLFTQSLESGKAKWAMLTSFLLLQKKKNFSFHQIQSGIQACAREPLLRPKKEFARNVGKLFILLYFYYSIRSHC